jgi:hypothetical protein
MKAVLEKTIKVKIEGVDYDLPRNKVSEVNGKKYVIYCDYSDFENQSDLNKFIKYCQKGYPKSCFENEEEGKYFVFEINDCLVHFDYDKPFDFMPKNENTIKLYEEALFTIPIETALYASDIIYDRWPKAEPIILTDPEAINVYIDLVLDPHGYKFPWPEAEEIISRNASNSVYYAFYLIQGPWLPGEEAISKDAKYSYYYANRIIKGRWIKGEKAILESQEYLEKYIEFLSDSDREAFLKEHNI